MGFKTFAAGALDWASKGAHLAKTAYDKYNELDKKSNGKLGSALKFMGATAANYFAPGSGDLIYSLTSDDKSSNWDKAGRVLSNPAVMDFGKRMFNKAKSALTEGKTRLHTTAENKKPLKIVDQGYGAMR